MKDYSLEKGQAGNGCGFRLVTVIASGLLIQLALGSFFTFGNMTPYVISYLRNRTDDTNLRNVDALWVMSMGSVMNCFGMTAGGMADRHFGPRIATLIGSLIFGGAVLLTSVAVRISMVFFVFTYGVILNFGMTMAYGPPVQTAIKWMPDRTTLAAGMIVAGFGGGAIIFNQVITAYINPDNLSPDYTSETGDKYFTDPDLLDRVPTCFLILGACYLTMTTIGILGLQLPPAFRKEKGGHVQQISTIHSNGLSSYSNGGFSSELGLQTQNGDVEKHDRKISKQDPVVASTNIPALIRELTIKETIHIAFRTRAFYILWITLVTLDGAQFLIGLYKVYGQTFISDDHFLALVGSLSSIFNCVGRPFWGAVMDKFGYKVTIRCMTGVFAVASATIMVTEHMHKVFFLVWTCALYFFFCGIWSVASATIMFTEHIHKVFFLIWTCALYFFFCGILVTIRCMTGVFVVASATIMVTEHMHKVFFLIWTCALYFFFCGIWSVAPSTLSKLFGPNNMAINYGIIFVATTIASILGSVIGMTLKDVIGWHGLFFLSAGMGAIPFILTFFFNGKDQSGKRF